MRSIRQRLSLGLGSVLVVVFLLAGAASSLAIRFGVRDYMITRLDHDAENLLAAITLAEGRDGPHLATTDPVYGRAYSGHYFTITVDGATLRSRSLWDHELPVPAVAAGESRTLRATGPEGVPLLMRVHGYERRGARVVVAVAEDFGPVQAFILRWQVGFALATLLVLLLVLLLQRRLLARGLAPLHRTREEVRQLEQGQRRALTPAAPAEIRPLIQALNRLLQTLEERLVRSRRATGDLAHGLKTPLSTLRGLAERPGTDPDLGAEMGRQLDIIQGRMERELRRARLAGASAAGAFFRPGTDVAELVQTLERIHRRRLETELRMVGEAAFPAEREDMLELLGNLLDNAFKWATGRIRLVVETGPGRLDMVLEDDGPGIPAEALARLPGRGVRLDESRAGHGLGLAIAGDIAAFYGGTLTLDRSPQLGGLRARVKLERGQT